MQRSVKASPQEDEINNIDAHLEYIKKALRWSINDLERFISLLKARVAAEELYVKSLSGISRLSTISEPEPCPHFGQEKSTYELATFQYELSLDKVMNSRRDFIQAMKTQIDVLVMVKDRQEQRRKTVKQHVADKNMDYINYRTRDFVKVKKAYFGKCNELATAQQLYQEGNSINNNHDSAEQSPTLTDEPRKSMDFDNDTDGSSICSLPDTTSSLTTTLSGGNGGGGNGGGNRKKMGGFMAQMRTQLAAATTGANDLSKQSARIAKIKKDIHDADHDYRQGVRYLEHLRKTQIETMNHAMKNVEVVFLDKAEATRSVLTSILNNEHAALLKEASWTVRNKDRVEAIDPHLDVSLFKAEYQKRHFTNPEQVYYENYYNGIHKDVLFGSSLDEYTMEHQRTVPLIVTKCIDAVEQMGGLQKEGIYRISGRQTNVDMLKTEFEKNEDMFQPQAQYDVFTIASVLKIYLRELMVPLVPYCVADRLTYSTVQNLQQRLSFLQHKVAELSQPRRDTLEAVVRHLEKVNSYSDVNKMNLQNLSYMFTPAIFHDHNQAEHPGEWQSDLVFEDLVLHPDAVFAPIPRQQPQQQKQQPQSQHPQQQQSPPPPQQQQQQQFQDTSSPSPLAHGQPSDFKDSLTAPGQVSGSAIHTNNITTSGTSRSRSSTLTQPNSPVVLPPSSSPSSPSSSPNVESAQQSTPSPQLPAHLPIAKVHSFNIPPSATDSAMIMPTVEAIAMNKTQSTPATPASATTEERVLLDSPASTSAPMSKTTSATSSTEPPNKTQGLLRRATLKARAAIPPRQQSLRAKHGRPSTTTATVSPPETIPPANHDPSLRMVQDKTELRVASSEETHHPPPLIEKALPSPSV